MRRELSTRSEALRFIARQNGLFSMLPLPAAAVERLQDEHGIYMAKSGRITITGLNVSNLESFVHAISTDLYEAA